MAFKKRRAGGEKRYWRENRANGQSPTIIAQHDTPNDYTVTFSKAFVRNGRQTSARLNRVERGHGGTDARLYRQLLVENFSGMFLENLDDFVAFRLLAFVRSKGIIFAVMFERFVLLFFFFFALESDAASSTPSKRITKVKTETDHACRYDPQVYIWWLLRGNHQSAITNDNNYQYRKISIQFSGVSLHYTAFVYHRTDSRT